MKVQEVCPGGVSRKPRGKESLRHKKGISSKLGEDSDEDRQTLLHILVCRNIVPLRGVVLA